jgi:hypothetical protein
MIEVSRKKEKVIGLSRYGLKRRMQSSFDE